MGLLYVDTGGSADNSGSTDNNTADLTGTTATRTGANTVQLDALTDLTLVDATAGSPTQSTINIAGATNTNTTIFWITGKSGSGGATPTLTVSVDPTGMTTNSWKIGGRHLLTNARIEAALRGGDTVQFNNSPAGAAAVRWTFRNAGDTALGYTRIVGKAGSRPVLNSTTTTNVVFTAQAGNYVENLELDQDGATGNVAQGFTAGMLYNIKISDGGANLYSSVTGGNRIIASEFSVTSGGGIGIIQTNGLLSIIGVYVHDMPAGSGIEFTAASGMSVKFTIVDTCDGRGMLASGVYGANSQSFNELEQVSVYNCGRSGLEVADVDAPVNIIGCIFSGNGTDGAGEYNVEWVAGTAENVSLHGWNCFYQNGAGGNLLNLTATSTEITTDPLFVDPANGDFGLQSGSPCKATSFPGQFLGGPTGYLDMGAVQRQETGGLGGGPMNSMVVICP